MPGTAPAPLHGFPELPPGMAGHPQGALPLSGVTMLLVEDSRFTSDALRLLCQRSGARMRRVPTLELARLHLRTYRPDVVIVDLGLPDGRGEELIAELAGAGPVVLASSGDPMGRDGALRAGAAGFLEKPLPGLGAFQRAVLRHLPGQCRAVVPSASRDRAMGDPMALHDDLRHVVDMLAIGTGPDKQRYLAGFLAGLARSTGDAELIRAAEMAATGAEGLGALTAALGRKLARGAVI